MRNNTGSKQNREDPNKAHNAGAGAGEGTPARSPGSTNTSLRLFQTLIHAVRIVEYADPLTVRNQLKELQEEVRAARGGAIGKKRKRAVQANAEEASYWPRVRRNVVQQIVELLTHHCKGTTPKAVELLANPAAIAATASNIEAAMFERYREKYEYKNTFSEQIERGPAHRTKVPIKAAGKSTVCRSSSSGAALFRILKAKRARTTDSAPQGSGARISRH